MPALSSDRDPSAATETIKPWKRFPFSTALRFWASPKQKNRGGVSSATVCGLIGSFREPVCLRVEAYRTITQVGSLHGPGPAVPVARTRAQTFANGVRPSISTLVLLVFT
jgi:hypothetical protein